MAFNHSLVCLRFITADNGRLCEYALCCGTHILCAFYTRFPASREAFWGCNSYNVINQDQINFKMRFIMFDIRKIQEQAIYNAVKEASDDNTAKEIVFGEREERNAAWVKSTMRRLEERFKKHAVKRIRMNCQCGYGMDEKLELLKELLVSSSNLEEFACHEKAKAAGMFYKDGELYLQFSFCPCPMLADVDRRDTDAWCQCTTGYSKVLFEKAFGCKVDVELLKSIKTGGDICLQKISPRGAVWK